MRARLILTQAAKGLARDKGMALAIALVTFVSILFVGSGALLRLQVAQLEDQWFNRIEVTIYMCAPGEKGGQCAGNGASPEQVEAVSTALQSPEMKPYVKEFQFETREKAYENFQRIYKDNYLAAATKPEMLPESFRVKLVDPSQFRIINEEFQAKPGVSRVYDQHQVVQPVLNALNRAAYMAWGLALVMTVAAVLLITTTIRLFAMSRERETAIMRLVGASNLFIQAPFILQSAIAAMFGAVLAIGAMFLGVKTVVQGWMAPSFPWTSFVGYRDVALIAPILLGVSLIFVAIAAAISLAKYTKV
ncbi:cell division protein FtsX [Boudabousia tangfeifanii]|uniref:Cell division protein FtsX n=1 Tax=Boudabousia tangfeifanii TaxID=1912795 RepID=A0A1D9MJ52_9ACTO|nr:permease-like cell division protein FtsX [Boudabousia tangfeifanii]AOZ72335.1 cell division protein FtsX [Boudabousia tangfeifanii]